MEQLYQDLGHELQSISGDAIEGKILLYAEVEDDVVSVSVYGKKRSSDAVLMRLGSPELEELVYRFWQRWVEEPGNKAWVVMSYLMDGDRFTIDLTYPEQIPQRPDRHPDDFLIPEDYREDEVNKYFGDARIDWSES
jgi:hypothetical protein